MPLILMPLLIVLTILFCGPVGCDNPSPEPVRQAVDGGDPAQGIIVCMGDSLTAGYGVDESDAFPARLLSKLREDGLNYQVINAGVSGETSSGALARLDWMLTLNPDIVILETGANDGLRGIDPNLTRRNIDAIVTRLKAEGIVVVLAGMQMVRNLGPVFTEAFRAIYPQVAETHDLILVPFFLQDVAGRADLNQSDGIHPTADGYRIVTDNLTPYVRQAIQRHREQGE